MFDRLRRLWGAEPEAVSSDVLTVWAQQQGLRRASTSTGMGPGAAGGSALWEGRWLDGALTAQCGPSTRPYISGLELSLRADLALRNDVRVVVMNRALKQALQNLSDRLFNEVTDSVQTTDKPLPEEVSWLALFRDAGWPGPEEDFWARFAVLTDSPELARDWLDGPMTTELLSAAASWDPKVPIWWGVLRGKVYLRAQWSGGRHPTMPTAVLRCFEHLAQRAQAQFGR